MNVAVVIPVKSFTMAKGRLADTLNTTQRAELAQRCAETVVRAALPLPTYVVCSDAAVATWAIDLGAIVVDCQTPGLDVAVTAGRNAAITDGADHIIIAHADLPLATSFTHIAVANSVSLVPDRHRDGTNVLSFPLHSQFVTAYGPGSFENHIRHATIASLPYVVIDDEALALDLDTADDLSELQRRTKDN